MACAWSSMPRTQCPLQWPAIESIAGRIGCTAETLRKWVRQVKRDGGARPGPTTAKQQRIKELEREAHELRKTNEIPKIGQRAFRSVGVRPPAQEVNAFIDEHRVRCGVEPICHSKPPSPACTEPRSPSTRFSATLIAR